MRKSVLIFLVLAVIRCSPAQQQPGTSIEGKWTGTFADSISSGTLVIVLKSEADGTVSGTYTASSGGFGTVAGRLEGSELQFVLTQAVQACTGSYSGTVTFHENGGAGNYTGSDCLGNHERGVISLERQAQGTKPDSAESPIEQASRKFFASLPANEFWWRKLDCTYCRSFYANGTSLEVIVTPDEVVAAVLGNQRSLWYAGVVVINESTLQLNVLRDSSFLQLIAVTPKGHTIKNAPSIKPESLARQRGKRIALAFFSGLAMSAPTYSQSNIYGSANLSGNTMTFNGTVSTYDYGGINRLLAYNNYLRGLATLQERSNWIEQASLKDTSLFHGQSAQGILWFKGKKRPGIASLGLLIDGKTFVFPWYIADHH